MAAGLPNYEVEIAALHIVCVMEYINRGPSVLGEEKKYFGSLEKSIIKYSLPRLALSAPRTLLLPVLGQS